MTRLPDFDDIDNELQRLRDAVRKLSESVALLPDDRRVVDRLLLAPEDRTPESEDQ